MPRFRALFLLGLFLLNHRFSLFCFVVLAAGCTTEPPVCGPYASMEVYPWPATGYVVSPWEPSEPWSLRIGQSVLLRGYARSASEAPVDCSMTWSMSRPSIVTMTAMGNNGHGELVPTTGAPDEWVKITGYAVGTSDFKAQVVGGGAVVGTLTVY